MGNETTTPTTPASKIIHTTRNCCVIKGDNYTSPLFSSPSFREGRMASFVRYKVSLVGNPKKGEGGARKKTTAAQTIVRYCTLRAQPPGSTYEVITQRHVVLTRRQRTQSTWLSIKTKTMANMTTTVNGERPGDNTAGLFSSACNSTHTRIYIRPDSQRLPCRNVLRWNMAEESNYAPRASSALTRALNSKVPSKNC